MKVSIVVVGNVVCIDYETGKVSNKFDVEIVKSLLEYRK